MIVRYTMRKRIARDRSSRRLPTLQEAVVVINGAAARRIGATPERYLSCHEWSQWASLPAARRTEWLCGRVALKRAFLDLCHGAVRDLEVGYRAGGRPMIAGHDDVYCSISHSGGWSTGATSRIPIGVDIEAVRPRRAELLRYITTERERRLLRRLTVAGDDLLTLLWTAKEAVLKALSVGLGVHPCRAEVTAIEERAAVVELAADVPLCPRRWNVRMERIARFYHSVATPCAASGE